MMSNGIVVRELIGDIVDAGYIDVARRIYDIWDYAECDAYLERLLLMDRVDRAGFPVKVVQSLMDLQSIRRKTTKDVWDLVLHY